MSVWVPAWFSLLFKLGTFFLDQLFAGGSGKKGGQPLFPSSRHFLYASRLACVSSWRICPQAQPGLAAGGRRPGRGSLAAASQMGHRLHIWARGLSSEPRWGETSSHHQISYTFPDVIIRGLFVLKIIFSFFKGKFCHQFLTTRSCGNIFLSHRPTHLFGPHCLGEPFRWCPDLGFYLLSTVIKYRVCILFLVLLWVLGDF